MKVLLFCYLIATICSETFNTVLPPTTFSRPPLVDQTQDASLLQPRDIAYREAMEFAQFLIEHGITVVSVHRSKLESFFRGVEKAAFFKTDKGIVEVIFFPEPTGAEKVQVLEQHKPGRYIYSFKGQPNPQPRDVIDSNRPLYFVTHRNLFIVTGDKEFHAALNQAFL